jgi:hypothetical protein
MTSRCDQDPAVRERTEGDDDRTSLRLMLARFAVAGTLRELEDMGLDQPTTTQSLARLGHALHAHERRPSPGGWARVEEDFDLAYASLDVVLARTTLERERVVFSFFEFSAALFRTAWEEWVSDREVRAQVVEPVARCAEARPPRRLDLAALPPAQRWQALAAAFRRHERGRG